MGRLGAWKRSSFCSSQRKGQAFTPRGTYLGWCAPSPWQDCLLEGAPPLCSPSSSSASLTLAKLPLEAGLAELGLFPLRSCLRQESGSVALEPTAPAPHPCPWHGCFSLILRAFPAQVLRDWQHQARSDRWLQAQSGDTQSGGQDC